MDSNVLAEFKLAEYYEIGEKFIQTKISNYLINSEDGGVTIFRACDDPRAFKLVEYKKYKEPWWFSVFKNIDTSMSRDTHGFTPDKWVIVLKFDLNKLYCAKLNLEYLSKIITKSIGKSRTNNDIATCAYSPLVEGEIHVFINFDDIYDYVKGKLKKNPGGANGDEDNELRTPETVLFYNVRDVFTTEIKNIIVRGVPGINKIFVKKDAASGSKGEPRYKIDTQGVNLIDILARTYDTPEVDLEKTVCDDMHEIFNILGIEAVRSFLVYEINRVLSFDGTYINIRHVSLLVDLMLRKGIITSVDRNGMGKEAGPLAAAMFEQTVKIITSCAATTEFDPIQSISSAVMLGELSHIGANTVKVIPKDRKQIPFK